MPYGLKRGDRVWSSNYGYGTFLHLSLNPDFSVIRFDHDMVRFFPSRVLTLTTKCREPFVPTVATEIIHALRSAKTR